MKKLTLFAVCCGLLLGACNKVVEAPENEKSIDMNSQQTPLKSSLSLLSLDEQLEQLKSFEKELTTADKNPNSKTVADAVWLLEATINKENGDAGWEFGEVEVPESSLLVCASKIGGQDRINMGEIMRLRNDLNTLVQSENPNLPNKKIVGVDLEVIANGICGSQANEYEVKIKTILGVAASPSVLNCTYTSTDSWYWGQSLGKCTGNGGNNQDATDVMDKLLNQCNAKCNGYYLNIHSLYFSADTNLSLYINPNDPTPGDLIRDYLLFYNNTLLYPMLGTPNPNYTTCLTPSDINFYVISAKTLAYNNLIIGEQIITYDVSDNMFPYPSGTSIDHNMEVFYGRCGSNNINND